VSKRRYNRVTRRLEVEFSAGGQTYKGISSNISIGGMFIRTQHAFVPDTKIDIRLFLPDGEVARLEGVVRRAIKTPHYFIKNGMGVEITKTDQVFENFLSQELLDYDRDYFRAEKKSSVHSAEDSIILVCPSCGVKNRLKKGLRSYRAKCGRCGCYLS